MKTLTANEIYEKYKIPPNLQEHQLTVTCVAEIIAKNMTDVSVDTELILRACLFHDMGNIIKYDMDNFPELMGDEQSRIPYWKKVREEFMAEYGDETHVATSRIGREIGLSEEVMFLIENWGFSQFSRVDKSDDYNWKICVYTDHRVSPTGIVSLSENLAGKRKRYSKSGRNSSHISDKFEGLFESAENVERQIKEHCKIDLLSLAGMDFSGRFPELRVMVPTSA